MSKSAELSHIKQILTFNAQTEDIFSIQGRMRALFEYYKANPEYDCLLDFLKVYLLVTEKVVDSRYGNERFFNYPNELNRLDVVFCSYYFKAVEDFVFSGSTKTPWVSSFKISTTNNSPFVNALMGINSHINGDLAVSLLDIKFKSKNDFDKVSSILFAVVPNVLNYLAFERMDLYGAFGLFAKKFIEEEFNKLIVKWRKDAFENYIKLKNSKNPAKDIKFIRESTETVSENIYNIFKTEVLNPINLIKDLNALEVKL